MDVGWAKIKRGQANDADRLAAVASGIGEYGIANTIYRLAGILRREAADIEDIKARKAFQCPKCLKVSRNENDIKYGYCGNCHDFTVDVGPCLYSGAAALESNVGAYKSPPAQSFHCHSKVDSRPGPQAPEGGRCPYLSGRLQQFTCSSDHMRGR